MKQFTTLAEFKGQLKKGNKLAIISHQILPNGKTDDTLYEGVVCEIFDNGFTYEYSTGQVNMKVTQWDEKEVKWFGSASLKKSSDCYCASYNSNTFGESSTILFKSVNGCYTFAIHPDEPSCCPKCKGSGINYTTYSEIGKPEKQISISSCYDCEGKSVDKDLGEFIRRKNETIDAMWCKCSHGDSYYVPDTKKMKHHWRCSKCRKITQIG